MIHTPISPDLPIADAARLMMAEEMATIDQHMEALQSSADEVAVHETRKAIRRTFTLFKLFGSHFAPGALEPHRRALRQVMRRLAPCRDLTVFRLKLSEYNSGVTLPLFALATTLDSRQTRANRRLRRYLARRKVRRALARYRRFVTRAGANEPSGSRPHAPLRVRHVLPALIFERLATVRAFGDTLPTATAAQFHQLRIQFKELRYTLSFFEDILGETSGRVIEITRLMQEHLGHLNDASVALDILARLDCCPDEIILYRGVQAGEAARLTEEFLPLYAQFDRPDLRQVLALAVGSL